MPLSLLRLYVPVFGLTLGLSAFLLFTVQPMFGKMILPLLGGAPAVWNTAMLFFQCFLLAGYAYAHASAHFLSTRLQVGTHLTLLALCALFLPLSLPAWTPPDTENPVFWQIGLMAVSVGAPFFVLSASAPLLQHWFSKTGHPDAHNPYFLYAASNIGSMGALLAYPFIIEPMAGIARQTMLWGAGYGLLFIAIFLTAALTYGRGQARPTKPLFSADNDQRPGWRLRGIWLFLAFVPSSLMLGVTTYVTTDLASAPLIWIIPLALYLGTFIIAFARTPMFKLNAVIAVQGVLIVLTAILFIENFLPSKAPLILLHFLLFFFSALACHMAVARYKPAARYLTEFYMTLSLGGVFGGVFNVILAPVMFTAAFEYIGGLILSLTVPLIAFPRQGLKKMASKETAIAVLAFVSAWAIMAFPEQPLLGTTGIFIVGLSLLALIGKHRWFMSAMAGVLILHPGFNWHTHMSAHLNERNFFGISRVYDSPQGKTRTFLHGTTIHGVQPLIEPYRLVPLSYYYTDSGLGDIFGILQDRPAGEDQRIAALGLGLGSVSCYARKGRHFDFYEIDPAVARIAQDKTLFTYLSDCGSPYKIIMGDARLKIAEAGNQTYDMILVDTFSSDSIPLHMITREAFALYLQKLKSDGYIAVNISNRFLNLIPPLAAIAHDLGVDILFKKTRGTTLGDPDLRSFGALYAVVTPNPSSLSPLRDIIGWGTARGTMPQPWTDDYANIAGALAFGGE